MAVDGLALWNRVHEQLQRWRLPLARLDHGFQPPVLDRGLGVELNNWFLAFAQAAVPDLLPAPRPILRTHSHSGAKDLRVAGLRAGLPLASTSSSTFGEDSLPAVQIQLGLGCRLWEPAAEEMAAWRSRGAARELQSGILAVGQGGESFALPPDHDDDHTVLVTAALRIPSDKASAAGRRPAPGERVAAMMAVAAAAGPLTAIRANGGVGHPMSSYVFVDPGWIRLPADAAAMPEFVARLTAMLEARCQWLRGLDRAAWATLAAKLGWSMNATNAAPAIEPRTGSTLWVVGANWSGEDKTAEFVREGVWRHGFDDRLFEAVRTMKPGDLIAIKASTTQRHDLPFEMGPEGTGGRTVSKMLIKARGTVTANPGDGRSVNVEWDPSFEERNWYFYTYFKTLWRVEESPGMAAQLRQFIFADTPQDYAYYLDHWRRVIWRVETVNPVPRDVYNVDDMVDDGVFVPKETLERALRLLRKKQNLILQGAPGTGKTFVARRLAYSLLAKEDDSRVTMVQFHPSTSYEDFVRGLRPTSDGRFALRNGPFLDLVSRCQGDPENDYVLIIDEINRGDLSQILGEMFHLLEPDKRGPKNAVIPLYRATDDDRLWVPQNLYVIGTMNIADRSLALVDFALRRRFAFLDLRPNFESDRFLAWLSDRKVPITLVDRIRSTMGAVNKQIREDRTLGPAFEVGHSFFSSPLLGEDATGARWLSDVIDSEILPLLQEYWHDNDRALAEARAVLQGSAV